VRRCETIAIPSARGPLTLAYGQRGAISLLVETLTHQPIPHARVTVVAQPLGWRAQPATEETADAHGRLTFDVPAGPSRALTFRFVGTPRIEDSAASASVLVRGGGSFNLDRPSAPPGGFVTFGGRVLGGYIPHGGALVQLQFEDLGIWNQFGPVIHTDQAGRWRTRRQLQPTAGRRTYLFQAVLVPQGDWPFLQAVTRPLPFTVG
jgi:hypothetical protein